MDVTLSTKDEIKCVACKGSIEVTDTHYQCEETLCGASMCEHCYFEEEFHKHVLHRVKGSIAENIKFMYKDPRTQNTLYVGEYPTAVPGSRTIKKCNIKSVLSILNFDDTHIMEGMEKLQEVFSEDDKDVKTGFSNGVLYHHIDLQDYTNPDQVKNYKLPALLAESVTFIEESLKRGNTLVHCERGQRRSPTVVLAFLISRGKTTDEALGRVNRGYIGEDNWARMYKKVRSGWVAKLRKFEKVAPKALEFFRRTEKAEIANWAALAHKAIEDLEEQMKEQEERDNGEEESEEEEVELEDEEESGNEESEKEENAIENGNENEKKEADKAEEEPAKENVAAKKPTEKPAEEKKVVKKPTPKAKPVELERAKYTPQTDELRAVLKPFKAAQQASLSSFMNGSSKKDSTHAAEKRKVEETDGNQESSPHKKQRLSLPGQ